ncbi:glycosyltransferase family 2 protein [Chloroflexota bacterium]
MIKVTVIIPTVNRATCLRKALISVQNQSLPMDAYEIIVVDNNSTDNTPQVVDECNKNGNKQVIYIKEPRIGLHNARHAGAKSAKGEILAYIDDDVICDANWLSELIKPYSDPKVGCVGGKILPEWESKPPRWVKYYSDFLSILDRADSVIEIQDEGIYGSNFSIRKDVLYTCGGFNPDAMARDLIRYRGDGETGLLAKAKTNGYLIIYTPFACVRHIIPRERLTIEYFKERAFIQGISNSYAFIRRNNGLECKKHMILFKRILKSLLSTSLRYLSYHRYILKGQLDYVVYSELAYRYHVKGTKFHRREVLADEKLLDHVLQESYLS